MSRVFPVHRYKPKKLKWGCSQGRVQRVPKGSETLDGITQMDAIHILYANPMD